MRPLKRLVEHPVYVILIAVAMILAAVLPTVILSRERARSLEIGLMDDLSLLVDDPLFSELSIRYQNQEIGDLTKISFRLENTGGVPIQPQDVERFPTLTFHDGTRFLLPRIESTDPPGIDARAEMTAPEDVTVEFGLLNPGDTIQFCVYASGLASVTPEVRGRIAGIPTISFIDYRTHVKREIRYVTVGVRVYFGISIFLLASCLSLVGEAVTERKTRATLARTPTYVEGIGSEEEMKAFIKKDLEFLTSSQKASLTKMLQDEARSFDDRRAQIAEAVSGFLSRPSSVRGAVLMCLVVSAIGSFFYFWELTH